MPGNDYDVIIFWLAISVGLIVVGCLRWLLWHLKMKKAVRIAGEAMETNPELIDVVAHTYLHIMDREQEEQKRKEQHKRYNQKRKRRKS